MRELLIAVARRLFKQRGYDDLSVPDISREAGVSREVLYACFTGKLELFEAVVESEFQNVKHELTAGAKTAPTPLDGLVQGGDAFIRLFSDEGNRRLLFDDAPRVLGVRYVLGLDVESTSAILRVGVAAAQNAGQLPANMDVDAIASLMSGAYDRAVLDAAKADEVQRLKIRETIKLVWAGLARLA